MRLSHLAVVSLLAASCGASDDGESGSDACERARRVHEQALQQALAMAPPCERDEDCVVMSDRASCEGVVDIDLCDRSVHRSVPRLYDAREVARRMCEVAAEAEYGCVISAACLEHGAPVCQDGACAFARP